MTFSRYRLLCEEWEDSPTADDILLAVHLPKHRRKQRNWYTGDRGIGAVAGMMNFTAPGQTRTLSYTTGA